MTDEKLFLKSLQVGPMLNLAYLIGDAKAHEVAVVDPGWDTPQIIEEAKTHGLSIVAILLTHGHYDHVDGADELAKKFNIPVYISDKEIPLYTPACTNLERTKDRQIIKIGTVNITCLQTPGHTPGCQCFSYEKHLLTGDTLFVGGCGRCDLPGGNEAILMRSMKEVIAKLADETIIYPGHAYGPLTSTLKKERRANPYLQNIAS